MENKKSVTLVSQWLVAAALCGSSSALAAKSPVTVDKIQNPGLAQDARKQVTELRSATYQILRRLSLLKLLDGPYAQQAACKDPEACQLMDQFVGQVSQQSSEVIDTLGQTVLTPNLEAGLAQSLREVAIARGFQNENEVNKIVSHIIERAYVVHDPKDPDFLRSFSKDLSNSLVNVARLAVIPNADMTRVQTQLVAMFDNVIQDLGIVSNSDANDLVTMRWEKPPVIGPAKYYKIPHRYVQILMKLQADSRAKKGVFGTEFLTQPPEISQQQVLDLADQILRLQTDIAHFYRYSDHVAPFHLLSELYQAKSAHSPLVTRPIISDQVLCDIQSQQRGTLRFTPNGELPIGKVCGHDVNTKIVISSDALSRSLNMKVKHFFYHEQCTSFGRLIESENFLENKEFDPQFVLNQMIPHFTYKFAVIEEENRVYKTVDVITLSCQVRGEPRKVLHKVAHRPSPSEEKLFWFPSLNLNR